MIECVAIGDSIAVGVAHYSSCVNQAQVFRTTAQTQRLLTVTPVKAGRVIVSVGSNDQVVTVDQLNSIRQQIVAQCVVWLLPVRNEKIRHTIQQVARQHQDRTIDVAPLVSSDGIHPTQLGYRRLARAAQCSHK